MTANEGYWLVFFLLLVFAIFYRKALIIRRILYIASYAIVLPVGLFCQRNLHFTHVNRTIYRAVNSFMLSRGIALKNLFWKTGKSFGKIIEMSFSGFRNIFYRLEEMCKKGGETLYRTGSILKRKGLELKKKCIFYGENLKNATRSFMNRIRTRLLRARTILMYPLDSLGKILSEFSLYMTRKKQETEHLGENLKLHIRKLLEEHSYRLDSRWNLPSIMADISEEKTPASLAVYGNRAIASFNGHIFSIDLDCRTVLSPEELIPRERYFSADIACTSDGELFLLSRRPRKLVSFFLNSEKETFIEWSDELLGEDEPVSVAVSGDRTVSVLVQDNDGIYKIRTTTGRGRNIYEREINLPVASRIRAGKDCLYLVGLNSLYRLENGTLKKILDHPYLTDIQEEGDFLLLSARIPPSSGNSGTLQIPPPEPFIIVSRQNGKRGVLNKFLLTVGISKYLGIFYPSGSIRERFYSLDPSSNWYFEKGIDALSKTMRGLLFLDMAGNTKYFKLVSEGRATE